MINAIRMIWNLFLIQYELKKEYLKLASWEWEFKYLEIDKNQKLMDYIESKIYELSKSEGVEVFILPQEIVNEKEVNRENWACGKFKYLNLKDDVEKEEYQRKLNLALNLINPTDPYFAVEKRKITYPRIELISEAEQDSRIMTFLHEMGHYFIYKKNEEQSEIKADLYIPEFFDTHLPPFFKWVFQCWLTVYGRNEEIKYTSEESFQYWNDYQNFMK